MAYHKCLAGTVLLCVLVAFTGCGSSPGAQGAECKAKIDAALERGDLAAVDQEMKRLLEHIQDLTVKDAQEFFAAWPDDSFDPWLAEVAQKLQHPKKAGTNDGNP